MRLLFAALLISAISPFGQSELWKGNKGTISFTSDAPLELIEAESKQLTGVIKPSENTFAFLILTKSFKGFNSPLQQEHFHENYMESDKYPKASFSGKFIENIAELKEGRHEVRAKGMLNIHGVEVERILKCTLEVDKGKVTVTSEFKVPLEDHKISIPQVVHQKIAEEILVTATIKLQPS